METSTFLVNRHGKGVNNRREVLLFSVKGEERLSNLEKLWRVEEERNLHSSFGKVK